MAYNIFRSHQNCSSRTNVMKNQNLGPIWPYLVLVFRGIFWRNFFEVFTILDFFWKFSENFQFSNMHKMAKWADWVIKNGGLQSFEANKPVLSKILVQKSFSAKWQNRTFQTKKKVIFGPFFEIATNVVFSNICWQHAPKVFFGSISI